jgi:hypothetical protein
MLPLIGAIIGDVAFVDSISENSALASIEVSGSGRST